MSSSTNGPVASHEVNEFNETASEFPPFLASTAAVSDNVDREQISHQNGTEGQYSTSYFGKLFIHSLQWECRNLGLRSARVLNVIVHERQG